jgi:hypothetical protein
MSNLVIKVLFFDLVDGETVSPTIATVNSRWMLPPVDWRDGDTEELAVEYRLPKPTADASKPEDRKYFGYLVRVYYKDQLQASAAEPRSLLERPPQ